jgi:hypothetical protein
MTTETNNNTFKSQPKSYTNSYGKNVLEYVTSDTIVLDLPFILIHGKRLTKSMPYMKLEKKVAGNDIKAIRLLDFEDKDGVIYLNVQELANGRIYTLSANMEYTGDFWLWSLADYETLIGIATDKNGA